MLCSPRGNPNASVMVVGEAPGKDDEEGGYPFLGASGKFLDQLLVEAGYDMSDIFYTNVARVRPPHNSIENFLPKSKKAAMLMTPKPIWYGARYCTEEIIDGLTLLKAEIESVRPNIIIAFGNTPLWALTHEFGVSKWRGSVMAGNLDGVEFKILPTYHPAAILRNYSWRWITIHDLKRALKQSTHPEIRRRERTYLVRPSYAQTIKWLNERLRWAYSGLRVKLAVDLETRTRHISCVGLADSRSNAICIPLMSVDDPSGYWSMEEELQIVLLLRALLRHPNISVVGQNYIYDQQYFALRMGFASNWQDDTMIKWQIGFPGTPKGLDFISSMMCEEYRYWKDEGKNWDPKIHSEEQHWVYNCDDACNTYECDDALNNVIDGLDMRWHYGVQMQDAYNAFKLMLRGMRCDLKVKAQMGLDLKEAMVQRIDYIHGALGVPVNINSPKQINCLLYDVFQLPMQKKKRHTKDGIKYTPTGDADAIDALIPQADAIYRPILQAIKEFRSLSTYNTTFAEAQVDRYDQRLRCSINVAGPETFRWSTSEDAFGTGMNLQNIPRNRE